MQVKKKFCEGCESDQYIWKVYERKKYCKLCWLRLAPPKPLNKSPLKKTQTYISPISESRSQDLAKYRKSRQEYFKENPVCEFPGCDDMRLELHHKRGRIGNLLFNKKFFCSLCHKHHVFIETHPEEAKRLGLSEYRL